MGASSCVYFICCLDTSRPSLSVRPLLIISPLQRCLLHTKPASGLWSRCFWLHSFLQRRPLSLLPPMSAWVHPPPRKIMSPFPSTFLPTAATLCSIISPRPRLKHGRPLALGVK